jgi:hypothetical protein
MPHHAESFEIGFGVHPILRQISLHNANAGNQSWDLQLFNGLTPQPAVLANKGSPPVP